MFIDGDPSHQMSVFGEIALLSFVGLLIGCALGWIIDRPKDAIRGSLFGLGLWSLCLTLFTFLTWKSGEVINENTVIWEDAVVGLFVYPIWMRSSCLLQKLFVRSRQIGIG